MYRIRDNKTGTILRSEATLLDKNGKQTVERHPAFAASGAWTDPVSGIRYPQTWTITLPTTGWTLIVTPAFADQTIPVIGIGDAIWEGVVTVSGTHRDGETVGGRGYMELVGYRAKPGGAKAAAGAR